MPVVHACSQTAKSPTLSYPLAYCNIVILCILIVARYMKHHPLSQSCTDSDTEMSSAKKRLLDTDGQVFCSHCEQSVAKRTYWLHKRTYFNSTTKEWQQEQDMKHGVSDAYDDSFVIDAQDGDQSLLQSDNGDSGGHPGSDHELPSRSQSVSHSARQVATVCRCLQYV